MYHTQRIRGGVAIVVCITARNSDTTRTYHATYYHSTRCMVRARCIAVVGRSTHESGNIASDTLYMIHYSCIYVIITVLICCCVVMNSVLAGGSEIQTKNVKNP